VNELLVAARAASAFLGNGFESMDVVPCTDSAVQANDFVLIPTVKMKNRHPVEVSFGREF